MPDRVRALALEARPQRPDSPGELTRLVLDSLALAYRRCVATASALAGVDPEVVHVVGGGSENELLCQLTADACGLPVVAGPKEAAALGNVLVQARALGSPARDGRGHACAGAAYTRAQAVRAGRLRGLGRPGVTADRCPFRCRRRRVGGVGLPGEVELTMRVALQVTCINDALFPETGKAMVTLLRRLGVDVEFPEAQTCCGQPMVNTGYLDEAVPALRSFVEAFSGYDAIVTPSGSCAGSARHQHQIVARRSGDAVPGRRRRADGAARLRADRVPRRPARRDRRGRLLPAPGDLPPDLSLAPDARGGRPATDAARAGPRAAPRRAARRRGVLRLRRHLRDEERRHVHRDGVGQGPARPRDRRGDPGGGRQLVPDAHRRAAVATALRGAHHAPRRGPGRHRGRESVVH